jgi:pyridoxamine 5'-phosphate oxidase
MVLFELWYKMANLQEKEPYTMVLSTILEKQPQSRVVYMREFTADTITFFSNYKSNKAKEIDKNANVALLFYWPISERQIRINGIAKAISREDSEAYFSTRPRKSQIGAWASEQSQVIENRQYLIERLKHFEQEFAEKEVSCPKNWGGYSVQIKSIEFWQGQPARLHDRFLYTKATEIKWNIQRLAP